MLTSHRNTISTAALRARIRGRVIAPGDSDYDAVRAVAVGGFDRRPSAIVRVANSADVARVVALARETGTELAVRSGGHSMAGHGVSDGGIVIDMRDMRSLKVDPRTRSAWAETGVTTGQYNAIAARHGLATGFGDSPSVGIGGITLGGGIGFLVRKHGLTIDSLVGAEIVTAAGEVISVDADRHPDLFWAIRGGGGNFGVATRLRYHLHELDGIVGGLLVLPATAEVIAAFVAAAEAAPEELSTIASVMRAPPLPFLPAEHHGKPVLMAMVAFAGADEAGQRALAPFRGLARPLADLVRPMPYPELFQPEPEGVQMRAALRTTYADGVDERAAATILERLWIATAPMAAVQLRVLGGASARVAADATAYAHRDRRVMVNVAAMYQRAEEEQAHHDWASESMALLRQGSPGAYANFLGDEGEERVREAYPGAAWKRLAAVKAQYDPDNLFRLNQNVPPAD
jgi:FAD/FMN-containing dehydrogenase